MSDSQVNAAILTPEHVSRVISGSEYSHWKNQLSEASDLARMVYLIPPTDGMEAARLVLDLDLDPDPMTGFALAQLMLGLGLETILPRFLAVGPRSPLVPLNIDKTSGMFLVLLIREIRPDLPAILERLPKLTETGNIRMRLAIEETQTNEPRVLSITGPAGETLLDIRQLTPDAKSGSEEDRNEETIP